MEFWISLMAASTIVFGGWTLAFLFPERAAKILGASVLVVFVIPFLAIFAIIRIILGIFGLGK